MLCYQQLLLRSVKQTPVPGGFLLFFLENKPGVLVFLLGYFCNKETAVREERGMHRCLDPAALQSRGCKHGPRAALLCCKGRRCCQPPPPSYTRAKPGSPRSVLICQPYPGSPGRAPWLRAGQIPQRVCRSRVVWCDKAKAAGQRAAKVPGKEGLVRRGSEQKGVSEINPKAGASPACNGAGGQTCWFPTLPAGSRSRGAGSCWSDRPEVQVLLWAWF